jgi:hypothetical protein
MTSRIECYAAAPDQQRAARHFALAPFSAAAGLLELEHIEWTIPS